MGRRRPSGDTAPFNNEEIMAYEVKNKYNKSSILEHNVSSLTDREPYSKEINAEYGEGGGLNAGYDVVEAVARYANEQGRQNNKENGKDFIFKTTGTNNDGNETVIFEKKE